jgi:hypothetical protein
MLNRSLRRAETDEGKPCQCEHTRGSQRHQTNESTSKHGPIEHTHCVNISMTAAAIPCNHDKMLKPLLNVAPAC